MVGQDRVPQSDARRRGDQRWSGSAHAFTVRGCEFADKPEPKVLDVRDGLGEQHPDVIVVQGIDDLPALAITDDQA